MVLSRADQRRREYEADLFGARLMRDAGYSLLNAMTAEYQLLAEHNQHYPPVDAVRSTHPCTEDRDSRMAALLGDSSVQHWRAMSAFMTGVALLGRGQYEGAEQGFEYVTRHFPDCPEAWANLGVARLMQYCAGLSPDGLRALGVGPIVGLSFYRRTVSLLTRG